MSGSMKTLPVVSLMQMDSINRAGWPSVTQPKDVLKLVYVEAMLAETDYLF